MKYKNKITGVLCVDKPQGVTSRDVVNEVQKVLDVKAGHTGTLDPIAHGVLVVTLGKATKLNEILVADDKEYIASAVLGLDSDTLDAYGKVLKDRKSIVAKEKIIEALEHFKGSYEQEVPKYSAVKINGKKLYEYAREGKEIKLPKRLVSIYDIKLLEYKVADEKTHFKFSVKVSKGTYIRSLIRDIASYLKTCGIMTNLVRTKQGIFKLEDCNSLEDIKNGKYKILKAGDIFDFPKIQVTDEEKFKIINGQNMDYDYKEVLFLDKDGNELAIYHKENGELRIWKMLYEK